MGFERASERVEVLWLLRWPTRRVLRRTAAEGQGRVSEAWKEATGNSTATSVAVDQRRQQVGRALDVTWRAAG